MSHQIAASAENIYTDTTNVFDCKLVEYVTLWSNKIMWGMDCDIEPLLIELYKLYSYSKVLNTLESPNECDTHIPVKLKQKIQKYEKALTRKQTAFCRNC
jgi:hypothetical protein